MYLETFFYDLYILCFDLIKKIQSLSFIIVIRAKKLFEMIQNKCSMMRS